MIGIVLISIEKSVSLNLIGILSVLNTICSYKYHEYCRGGESTQKVIGGFSSRAIADLSVGRTVFGIPVAFILRHSPKGLVCR